MAVMVARHRLQKWPGPSNTGVPAGTSLTNNPGNFTTSSNGQIVDALDVVEGSIIIAHDNVTVKRCRVLLESPGGIGCIFPSGTHTGLLLEDCEFDGNLVAGGNNIFDGTNITMRRCNLHSAENGIDVNGNIDMRDCWIHDLAVEGVDPHSGCSQFNEGASNVTFVHNVFDPKTPASNSACGMYAQPGAQNASCTIVGNKILGNAALNVCSYTFIDPSNPTPTNIVVNYNRMTAGAFGYWFNSKALLTEAIGNVDDITGAAI